MTENERDLLESVEAVFAAEDVCAATALGAQTGKTNDQAVQYLNDARGRLRQVVRKIKAQFRDKLAAEVDSLIERSNGCPKCGGMMVHSRLRGYHCLRECR